MRNKQKWGGLITHASPYLLPPGANQEQINVHCRTPGQLQCRQGMSRVSAEQTVPSQIRDVCSLRGTQGSALLSLTSSGQLVALQSLELSTEPGSVFEPSLATGPSEFAANYLWQYQVSGGATLDLVFVFYGGNAATESWDYTLRPGYSCDGISDVSAGKAEIDRYTGIQRDRLCQDDSN
jgi:hypothetical protein